MYYIKKKIRKFRWNDPSFYAERCFNPKSESIVDAVKDLPGVWLELRGRRLCVRGKTYQYKDLLMELNFKWDYEQKYWYHRMTFNLVA